MTRFARTCPRRSVRSGSTQETRMSLGQESSILTQKRCNFVSNTPDRVGMLGSIASNSFHGFNHRCSGEFLGLDCEILRNLFTRNSRILRISDYSKKLMLFTMGNGYDLKFEIL